MIHKAAALAAVFTVTTIGCGGAPAFTDQGAGNGTSRNFHLNAGSHRITYEATDREPFIGCKFGISFETPSPDPLAPGRVIVKTDILTIDPHGRLSEALLTPHLVAGQYTIDYLGDVPCDWIVTVS